MKSPAANALATIILGALANSNGFAQTMAPTPNQAISQAAQLQELARKIDEQNAKIDMLSQQILKLQLEITNHRPGVMIGESTPTTSTSISTSPTTSTSAATSEAPVKSDNGNSHVVARGETLTSIAKM